jgi:hypothetical protein
VRFDIIFSPTGQISNIIRAGVGDRHLFSPNILLRLVSKTIWAEFDGVITHIKLQIQLAIGSIN